MKKAFTMAEVLITIGVIGIVAAMTMPGVIKNYQKKQTVVQLKKVYTTLSQAYMQSVYKNGPSDTWVDGSLTINTESVKKYVQLYWLPYFKSLQECSKDGDCGYDVQAEQYNGDTLSLVGNNRYTIILMDGTLIAFVPFSWNEASGQYWGNEQKFYIDLNGPRKPNFVGKDVFILQLHDNKVIGLCNSYTNAELNNSCSKTGSGQCCAEKIIRDGWEIKDDYPW